MRGEPLINCGLLRAVIEYTKVMYIYTYHVNLNIIVCIENLFDTMPVLTVVDPEGGRRRHATPPPQFRVPKTKKNDHIWAEICSRTHHFKP